MSRLSYLNHEAHTDSTLGEKSPKSKEMIRGKVAEYMERAEKLKTHLSQNDASNKRKPSAMGSNGREAAGSGKGKYVVLAQGNNTYPY